jgi:uncharacterized protein YfaA (DUF2138 family)
MNKKTLGKIAAVVTVLAGTLIGYGTYGWGSMNGPVNSLKIDLSKPDALVVTRSLSTLPRDLLTVPLARDVLREDFLFYYEQTEDRLGLKGSLRRIAYEHELGWGDQLIRTVLDEPAEVAMWRDGDGSLKHYAIAVSRGKLARVLEEAGKVALKDTQLTIAGDLRVDGDKVTVYALNYAYQRTLLFAAHGERMVILSHPGMLYGEGKGSDSTAESTVIKLLAKDPARQKVFHEQFHFDKTAADGHSIAIKADFLSFGYQPFFGALQALRFDFSKGTWNSQVLLDAAKLPKEGYDSSALWAALPYNPSGCFALPADWPAMQPVLKRIGAKSSEPVLPLATELHGPAAACWYGDSRLHTPVLVATRSSGSEAMLASLFAAAIRGGKEAQKTQGKHGEVRWSSTVTTALGETSPALAISGQTVVFSADGKLVDHVLAVKRKELPAAADRLPDAKHTVGLIAPASLARLIEQETFDTLPASSEPVLRGAVDQHMVPRLNALKKYPPYRMVLKSVPASGISWQPLEWQVAGK